MITAEDAKLIEQIARLATAHGLRIVAAESLTAGGLATELAAGREAGTWFDGSFVTYSAQAKHRVLEVTAESAFSTECALQMAAGALDAMDADVAVAVTGVGGPEPQDGEPVGRVFIATGTAVSRDAYQHQLTGDPEDIISAATALALGHLRDAVATAAARTAALRGGDRAAPR